MAKCDSFDLFSSSSGEESDVIIENLNSTAKDTETSEVKCI